MGAASETTDAMQRKLLAVLQRVWPDCNAIEGLRRLSGGASKFTWSLDARCGDLARALILRQSQPGVVSQSGMSIPLLDEAAVIRTAAAQGVPVPVIEAVLDADDGLGQAYLMARVEGETLGKRIVHDARFERARARMAAQCGALLARIHAAPLDGLPGSLPRLSAQTMLDRIEATHVATGRPRPIYALAFRWLREHLPLGRPMRLVHGDFRTGNLMVDDDGVAAVLDWELACIADPMIDLGWLCVTAWRYGAVDRPVGGFGQRDALFRAYEAAGGEPVDPAVVHFWEVFGSLRWGTMCEDLCSRDGADDHPTGRPSLERVVIGRRASEAEIDLMRLLARAPTRADLAASVVGTGVRPGGPDAAHQAAGTHAAEAPDRFGVDRLLHAVTAFVAEDAVPGLSGRAGFEARVARNALEIIRRECRLGRAAEQAEREGLRRLLDTEGSMSEMREALCRRVAAGEVALDDEALVSHLWIGALNTLAIDQPGYGGFRHVLQQLGAESPT